MKFPEGFLEHLKGIEGFDEHDFIEAHSLSTIPVSIRINPLKVQNKPDNLEKVLWCDNGFYLPNRISFTFDPLFHAGCYYVQEASSMFIEHILSQLPGLEKPVIALDLCASPGGKTTQLISNLNKDSLLISNEIDRKRVMALCDNVIRWGANNVAVTNNHPSEIGKFHNLFDIVLVDAPCSGSGMFRKDSDSVGHWSYPHVIRSSHRQQKILDSILPSLKENGYLIYSTCSYSKEENEDIVEWLRDREDLENVIISVPSQWGVVLTGSQENQNVGYRFFPYLVKGEGFFVTVFRKKNHPSGSNFRNYPSKTNERNNAVSRLIELPDKLIIKEQGDFFATPENYDGLVNKLQSLGLKLIQFGLRLGQFKGKDFIPAHDLALSKINSIFCEKIEVDSSIAIAYLQGQQILPEYSTDKPWKLILYRGFGLGWLKSVAGRNNNYYPSYLRIRNSSTETNYPNLF